VPEPFLVLATQNPIESEGTYALPEAQVDRFLFKLLVDYPASRTRWRSRGARDAPVAGRAVLRPADLLRFRLAARTSTSTACGHVRRPSGRRHPPPGRPGLEDVAP
jgi:MoxR-like ATPase